MSGAVLVVFHMTGCPHCISVTGSSGACAGLKDVGVLEIEAMHPLVEHLRITSFPRIWLSTSDNAWEYRSGPRTSEAIQEWIYSKLAPVTAA
jgi:hypothetical protein